MNIGINWTSPYTLPLVRELIQQGAANFCEIMVDNAIHLSPTAIQAALPDVPFSLHIVSSHFLEKSSAELNVLAQQLRPWIKALRPFYVSDHLLQFTTTQGVRLPYVAELDYEKDYTHIKNRVNEWQTLLDTPMLFENHASLTARGTRQADFFAALIRDTGAGVLFDFSNAYIAEYNQVSALSAWDAIIQKTQHFHVAGFKLDKESQLAIDTHDVPLADAVVEQVKKYLATRDNTTLVIEFDANAAVEVWKDDIQKIIGN